MNKYIYCFLYFIYTVIAIIVVDEWTANRDAILIKHCDHNWLFNQVCAVVHHGGAGIILYYI